MTPLALVAHRSSPTNAELGPVLTPSQAIVRLRAGDVALGRLDVMAALDGIERGLWVLDLLERRGVTVLNGSASLARAHDKLATAAALRQAMLPHPETAHVAPWLPFPRLEPPLVLKPRFGSWGRDVVCCDSRDELRRALREARSRVWFNASGGVVQQLVPPAGYDLRLLVAAGAVVGGIHRIAPEGEWRTNVALGGRRVAAVPDGDACRLALAAAAAVGGDLLGVDLLPLPHGGWVVLEVNGAVDFTREYSFPGEDVYARVHAALATVSPGVRIPRRVLASA